jgi:hypothetical protein
VGEVVAEVGAEFLEKGFGRIMGEGRCFDIDE